ncbi:MAG TPA: class I SAM-dependent methyltransferase [Longimicrobiaceae bacterium]|nr:class I SAM-dependent methyltransferase [Longimicrobiaceae bacterium]
MRPFAAAHGRRYLECPVCGLVYLDPAHRPAPEAELAHYGTHRNDPADPGYRAFLDRLAAPLVERLPPGAEGLDYGSGPGPALAAMLRERGFAVEVWDPFFAPDPAPLGRAYDFVTCTETAEHFFSPAHELRRLDALLRPGGWLGVMTELYTGERAFGEWRYARDPTHVCFYRPETLRWIAERRGWALELPARDVAFFRKPPTA